MIAAGMKKELPSGSVLIQEGQTVESLFLVLDGVLSVTKGSSVPIARLMSGEIVGEISFVDKHPPSASVQAPSFTNSPRKTWALAVRKTEA